MDRHIVYAGQIPLEVDLLNTNKNAMIGIGKLVSALFGSSTFVAGFSTGPNSPADLTVKVQAGEIYTLKNIDDTAYSSLTADTTHQLMKQGVVLDVTTLSCPAPGTAGQSINYLVQVAFSETDSSSTVLPYYNSSNPSVAWTGPNNTGTAQPTKRADLAVVTVKSGTAATTGSQVTPTPDAGNVGLYVVTVANGQTTITAGNITQYSGNANVAVSGAVSDSHNKLLTKSVAGNTDVTLTAQEAAYPIITLTGALTGNINLIVPATSHQWIIQDSTSGAFTITVKTAAGTGIATSQGGCIVPFCDGVNVIAASGSATGTTRPQFDNTTFFATTAFVQRALGSVRGLALYGVNTTLTAADVGRLIPVSGAGVTITLPQASALTEGACFEFINANTGNSVDITRAGSDTFWLAGLGTATTITLPAGETLKIVAYPTSNRWYCASGSAAMNFLYPSVQGSFKKLALSATGLSAVVTVTADELVLEDGSNVFRTLRSVSLTPSLATSGANGLDTGTSAASTWYSVWVIQKPDGTTAGLLSLSATAPTMPSGYTFKTRVGWVRSDGTGNKFPLAFQQYGRRVRYKVAAGTNVTAYPTMASGTAGTLTTTTYTPVSVAWANFFPSTASMGVIQVYSVTAGQYAVASPSAGFSGWNTTNPPPVGFDPNGAPMISQAELMLESANLYWASQGATGSMQAIGWEDNI